MKEITQREWEEIVERAYSTRYDRGQMSDRIWREIELAGYRLVKS